MQFKALIFFRLKGPLTSLNMVLLIKKHGDLSIIDLVASAKVIKLMGRAVQTIRMEVNEELRKFSNIENLNSQKLASKYIAQYNPQEFLKLFICH